MDEKERLAKEREKLLADVVFNPDKWASVVPDSGSSSRSSTGRSDSSPRVASSNSRREIDSPIEAPPTPFFASQKKHVVTSDPGPITKPNSEDWLFLGNEALKKGEWKQALTYYEGFQQTASSGTVIDQIIFLVNVARAYTEGAAALPDSAMSFYAEAQKLLQDAASKVLDLPAHLRDSEAISDLVTKHQEQLNKAMEAVSPHSSVLMT